MSSRQSQLDPRVSELSLTCDLSSRDPKTDGPGYLCLNPFKVVLTAFKCHFAKQCVHDPLQPMTSGSEDTFYVTPIWGENLES